MRLDYVVKRFGIFLLIVWLASSLNFFLPRLGGQDPMRAHLLEQAMLGGYVQAGLEEMVQEYNVKFGLDKPLWQQYLSYWGDIFRLDLAAVHQHSSVGRFQDSRDQGQEGAFAAAALADDADELAGRNTERDVGQGFGLSLRAEVTKVDALELDLRCHLAFWANSVATRFSNFTRLAFSSTPPSTRMSSNRRIG